MYYQENHIDGPLLICDSGTLHWLSLFERIKLKFGFITLQELNNKYNGVMHIS